MHWADVLALLSKTASAVESMVAKLAQFTDMLNEVTSDIAFNSAELVQQRGIMLRHDLFDLLLAGCEDLAGTPALELFDAYVSGLLDTPVLELLDLGWHA
jgi:hypothetical protein